MTRTGEREAQPQQWPEPGARALVAVVDRHRTVLWRVDADGIAELEAWDVDMPAVEVPHMSAPPKQGFHRGTGGPAATDVMQRRAEHGVERNLTRARDRVRALAQDGEWVLVTGERHLAARLHRALGARLRPRAVRADTARPHTPAQEVRAAARAELEALDRRRAEAELQAALARNAGTHHRG